MSIDRGLAIVACMVLVSCVPTVSGEVAITSTTASGPNLDLTGSDPFVPPSRVSGDRASVDVTFIDGSTATIGWPADLNLMSLGVQAEPTAFRETPNGIEARSLAVYHATVDSLPPEFGHGELLSEYDDGTGGTVGLWQFEGWEWDYLTFQFGDWVVLVYDYWNSARMSEEDRALWAESLHGEETPDGFLLLEADPPLGIGAAGDQSGLYAPVLALRSRDGWLRLKVTECVPGELIGELSDGDGYAEWCDQSGRLLVRVEGGTEDFQRAVFDGLEISGVEFTTTLAADPVIPVGWVTTDFAVSGERVWLLGQEGPIDPGTAGAEMAVVFEVDGGVATSWGNYFGTPNLIHATEDGLFVARYSTGSLAATNEGGPTRWVTVPELPFAFGHLADARQFVPNDLDSGFGSMWMLTARGAVARFDPDDGTVEAVIALTPPHPQRLAVGELLVWVAEDGHGLSSIDPDTGSVQTIPADELGHSSEYLAVQSGRVFVAGHPLGTFQGSILTVIDETTSEIVATRSFDTRIIEIGRIGGQIGALTTDGQFHALHTDGLVADAVPTDMGSGIIKVIDGSIWQASFDGRVGLLGLEAGADLDGSMTARTLDFDLPEGWQVAESSLTPNLGDPREILSVGTFPMVAGGDTCAQVPESAMEALGPEDVLVSLQERSQVDASSFGPRPVSFEPLLDGIDRGDAFECVDPSERADIGTLLWLPFRDDDRGFYLIVVMGTEVTDETRDQTVAMLDSLDFGT